MANDLQPTRTRSKVDTAAQQIDLFVADILDVSPKGDLSTMEHPVFALSTRPDLDIWRFETGEKWIEVTPSQAGRPTIFDKDLLMYCISQVVEGLNRSRPIHKRVHITAYDFLKATGRGTSGRDYEALMAALKRLRGVTISTNIGSSSRRGQVFGLIEGGDIIEKDGRGRMVNIEIVLSDWILRQITDRNVLTYSPLYYKLRKPNERRLYEICRKFCGTQAIWQIGEEKLYQRFGTRASAKEFRRMLKEMIQAQNIPEYTVDYDGKLQMFSAFYTPKGKAVIPKFCG